MRHERIDHSGNVGLLERRESRQYGVTAASSRVVLSTLDGNAFDPGFDTETIQQAEERLKGKNPDDIDYNRLSQVTTKYNKESTELKRNAGKNNDEIVSAWNTKIHDWIKEYAIEAIPSPQTEELQGALSSLGIVLSQIDKRKTYNTFQKPRIKPLKEPISQPQIELYAQIEDFRKRYFDGEKNIKQFVIDLGNGCLDDENHIDLLRFEKRIKAAKDIFKFFGTKNNIHKVIAETASAHGHLSQKDGSVKNEILHQVVQTARQDIDEDKIAVFQEIAAKQKPLTQPSPPQAESVETQMVESAQNQALTAETVEANHAKIHEIEAQYQRGEIGERVRDRHLKELAIAQGATYHKDVTDFIKELRRRNYDESSIRKIVKHEGDHFDKAQKYRLRPVYRVTPLKDNPYGFIEVEFITPTGPHAGRKIDEILTAPGFGDIRQQDSRFISDQDYRYMRVTRQHVAHALAMIARQKATSRGKKDLEDAIQDSIPADLDQSYEAAEKIYVIERARELIAQERNQRNPQNP